MIEKLKRNRQKGFTIIEVMIVLAIAGLIMVVVLIAVPQLQRNQRNSARQAIVARMSTEINNYAGNNNGNIPASATNITDLQTRYFNGVERRDPRTGSPMTITYVATAPATGVPTGADLPALGQVFYRNSRSCNGEALAGGSARNFALWIQQEGGAIFCIDNL